MLKKLKEIMIIKYVKKMHKTHSDFKNYGIDFDYNLTKEFNKELLVREITRTERLITNKICHINGIFIEVNEDEITEDERFYALNKILVMIDMGLINPHTLSKVKAKNKIERI